MMEIDVFELAKQVPIETVIGHYLPLKFRGSRAYGLCPFHNDHRIGSFVVNGNKGKFICFACGEKGDNIDFVSHICGIDGLEAAVTICETEALISHSDAMDIREKRSNKVNCITLPQKKFKKPELLLSPKASADHLDLVYQCFVRAAGELPESIRCILRDERHLADDEMGDFFPFPIRNEQSAFWPKFRAELTKKFGVEMADIQDKLLLGVPGFFVNDQGLVRFSTSKIPGMGIIIHARDRKISGLQIRRTGELQKDESRYVLFSSGFADGTGKYPAFYGCNSGYIEDVVYPRVKWNGTIAATEGRFKAITLSKMGCLVVNMHSISNWDPAGDVALALLQKYPKAKRFLLVYDSEKNSAVMQSAKSLLDKLDKSRPVYFAAWDSKYGKGIDDVVNAGNQQYLKSICAEEYFVKAS